MSERVITPGYVRQLEEDLRRERLARREIDAAFRDLMVKNEKLEAQIKELKKKKNA